MTETATRLEQRYAQRRQQQLPLSDAWSSHTSREAARRILAAQRSQQPSGGRRSCSGTLHELLEGASGSGSDGGLDGGGEDLSEEEDCAPALPQDPREAFTATGVAFPRAPAAGPRSPAAEAGGSLRRLRQLPDSCRSCSSSAVKVYAEMMGICMQLKAERRSQQRWGAELREREARLERREEAPGSWAGPEETLRSRCRAAEEQELSQLQDLLKERNKENRRLRSSFDMIKTLNDNMKKQLSDISGQNEALKGQSQRVRARLENLQRKCEQSGGATRGCHREFVQPPARKEKAAAPGKPCSKSREGQCGTFSPTQLKLLDLLLVWILDGQMLSSAAGSEGKDLSSRNQRCLQVLPLLVEQLHLTPPSEPGLLLNLLRLIHWVLRRIEDGTKHVTLFATLGRLGQAVSKPPAPDAAPQSEDPDLPRSCGGADGRPRRSWPLYRSPCSHTRILAALIIFRTVTQADVLAQALDGLRCELKSDESRALFLHHGGLRELLSVLRSGRGGLRAPVDVLMRLTEQSRHLSAFLEACSCEEFFQTASQLLRNPHLELPTLEKLSILLQKLSGIRRNRRLFELSSLHLQLRELHGKTSQAHTFLRLNLRSILHNLK